MNDRLSSTLATTRAPGRSHRAVALARLGRWKWTLLALVVGPLAAWLWSRSPDALTASGYSISQAQFESGLLRVVKHPETGEPIIGRDGEPRRHFGDLTLYRTNHRDAYGRDTANTRQECWNPRAGHYEEVRAGEFQGDLDFGRCRLVRF